MITTGRSEYLGMKREEGEQFLKISEYFLHDGKNEEDALGTMLHEMGYVVGLAHEFSRDDAKNYVDTVGGKCIKNSSPFGKPIGEFDEESIM